MALAYSLLVAGLGSRIDDFLIPVLDGQGYDVHSAIGRDQLLAALGRDFDLVLLDLPSPTELPQLAEVRAATACPLLIIGPARSDKLLVAALEQGADDYVQRPFRTDELLARIRAQLRRRLRGPADGASFGRLQINPGARQISRAGEPLDLSPEEFALLATLAAQPGFCHPPAFLLEQIWGSAHRGDVALLAATISRLRALIEDDPSAPRLLGGEPATGYWLSHPGARQELRARP